MARSAARAAPAVVSRTTPPRPSAAPAPVGVPAAGRSARPAPGPPAVRLTAIGTAHPATLPDVPAGGGEAIPEAVQGQLNVSLKADLKVIRLHTNPQAQELARSLSARAVTYGRDIFLGPGEQPTDVELIGHEVAHVIQQQGVPQVQRWSNEPEDACEREARSASSAVVRGEPFTVRERTSSPRVQRWGLSDVLDYFADKANNIPGFRMFTIVLGVNPINWSRVERSAANILRALIEFLPGGKLITDALNEYGIFDKIGNWVEQQLKTLGDIGASIKKAIGDFLDSLGWRDIFRLGSVWNRAKRIFTDPITRIIDFGKGLVIGILKFIKEAILKPLAKLAEKTRGYDLLKAVIGEDPVTGEKVPRTPDTLIGGFMKLIGQEEVWNNIKKANAIGRAWTWFQGVLSGLLGFVRQIPALFIAALKSLELFDVVLPPRAFVKLARVFGNFIVKFLSWGLQQVFGLLQIIFEVVAPGAVPYIRKAAGAFKKIIENPVGFIRNLVRAGIQGFKQFVANFLGHLRKSLIEWLTGTMSGANIHIPQAFTLSEIIKFVLSVLGLTWQNIRGKLVNAIGEPAVKALETGFDIVVTLVKEGPAAAWDKIVQAITNLKEMVIEEAMNFVKRRVVEAAIQKLLTSLNPAGAFIQAIIAIYNTIMFFVERLKQIARVAMAFIDSIAAIASGVIAAAANKVETTMAGLLTLVISFLARIAGLGKVSDAVKDIINRVRAPIDKGLDKVIEWIVNTAKKLGRLVVGAVRGAPPDARSPQQKQAALAAAVAEARRLDPTVGRRRLVAALQPIRERHRLTTLTAAPAAAGQLRVQAAVNPAMTFELADYDDGMLDDLHAAFLSGSAAVAALTAAERTKDELEKIFVREVRQRHAGVVVKVIVSGKTARVLGKPPGARMADLLMGTIALESGVATMDPELALRAAVAAGRKAVEKLGKKATWSQAQGAFTSAITAAVAGAIVEYEETEGLGHEAFLRQGKKDRRRIGVIVQAEDSMYESIQMRGPQQLLRHRVNGREFVKAAKDLIVQRYVWRNVNSTEAAIITSAGEGIIPDLPPRAMAPDAPKGLRGRTAKDPRTHVINAKMASVFSSATTIEGGQIVNRQTGQVFNVDGTIQIDLLQVDPDKIVVLSTAAGRAAWGLTAAKPDQAELDAAATREVLIRGGVPGRAIVRGG